MRLTIGDVVELIGPDGIGNRLGQTSRHMLVLIGIYGTALIGSGVARSVANFPVPRYPAW
jgi:hypothetical protein